MFIVNKKYACNDLATIFNNFNTIIFDDTKTIEDLLKKIEVILTTLYLTNRYYNENFLIEKVKFGIDLFYKKELEYFIPNDNSYTKLVNEIEKKVKREIKLDSILE